MTGRPGDPCYKRGREGLGGNSKSGFPGPLNRPHPRSHARWRCEEGSPSSPAPSGGADLLKLEALQLGSLHPCLILLLASAGDLSRTARGSRMPEVQAEDRAQRRWKGTSVPVGPSQVSDRGRDSRHANRRGRKLLGSGWGPLARSPPSRCQSVHSVVVEACLPRCPQLVNERPRTRPQSCAW